MRSNRDFNGILQQSNLSNQFKEITFSADLDVNGRRRISKSNTSNLSFNGVSRLDGNFFEKLYNDYTEDGTFEDIDIQDIEYNRIGEIAKLKEKSHINRVLLWFGTKKFDYIRQSGTGGILYSLLGSKCSKEELPQWEKTIQDEFNKQFSTDLEMIYIHMDITNEKKLTIDILVKDKVTDETTSASFQSPFN